MARDELADHIATLDSSVTEELAEGFKALADPHRLNILHLLLRCGEMCACEIMLAMEMPQSNLSFHMKTLKQAGFVRSRKSGRWMYYTLHRTAVEHFLSLFSQTLDLRKWPDRPRCTACDGTKGVRGTGGCRP